MLGAFERGVVKKQALPMQRRVALLALTIWGCIACLMFWVAIDSAERTAITMQVKPWRNLAIAPALQLDPLLELFGDESEIKIKGWNATIYDASNSVPPFPEDMVFHASDHPAPLNVVILWQIASACISALERSHILSLTSTSSIHVMIPIDNTCDREEWPETVHPIVVNPSTDAIAHLTDQLDVIEGQPWNISLGMVLVLPSHYVLRKDFSVEVMCPHTMQDAQTAVTTGFIEDATGLIRSSCYVYDDEEILVLGYKRDGGHCSRYCAGVIGPFWSGVSWLRQQLQTYTGPARNDLFPFLISLAEKCPNCLREYAPFVTKALNHAAVAHPLGRKELSLNSTAPSLWPQFFGSARAADVLAALHTMLNSLEAAFAESNNTLFDFTLSDGTLLGLLKFEDFLPWDSDIDVQIGFKNDPAHWKLPRALYDYLNLNTNATGQENENVTVHDFFRQELGHFLWGSQKEGDPYDPRVQLSPNDLETLTFKWYFRRVMEPLLMKHGFSFHLGKNYGRLEYKPLRGKKLPFSVDLGFSWIYYVHPKYDLPHPSYARVLSLPFRRMLLNGHAQRVVYNPGFWLCKSVTRTMYQHIKP